MARQPQRRPVAPQTDDDAELENPRPAAARRSALAGVDGEGAKRREPLPPLLEDDDDDRDPSPGDEERTSRAQEAREHDDIHDDDDYEDNWEQPRLLDAPEPRPGMVQRWIRTTVGNAADARNHSRAMNRGWTPRLANTVGKGFHVPTIAHGAHAGHIVVEGMVLMEMPKRRHDERIRNPVRNKTRALEQAVSSNLDTVHEPGTGFGKPRMINQSRVTRGRRQAAPASDDDQ